MRYGIAVSYRYDGDEAAWEKVVADFTRALAADAALGGRFSYHVQKSEGGRRLHIGRWDAEETVKLMQSRAYFTRFAAALKGLAGDGLSSRRFEVTHAATP